MWGGRPDWRAVFPTPIPYAELQGGVEFAFIPGAAGLIDGGLPASRVLVQVGQRGEEGLLASGTVVGTPLTAGAVYSKTHSSEASASKQSP